MEAIFILFVLFIIVYAIVANSNSKKNSQKYNPKNIQTYTNQQPVRNQNINYNDNSEFRTRNTIVRDNPDFSEDSFKRFVEMVYVRYLASITQKDANNVKEFLHDQMYLTHKNYIDTITISNRNIKIENIIVGSIVLEKHERRNNIETLRVHIKSKMNQYETDNNGMVISGYRSRIVSKDDILTFQRDHNALHNGDTVHCPNCMAELPAVSTTCRYCGSAIKYNDRTNEGWKLCDVTTL